MKRAFGRTIKYLLISMLIFAITTAIALLIAHSQMGYLSPAYISPIAFGIGVVILITGGFSFGSMFTARMAGSGISQSPMRDVRSWRLMMDATKVDGTLQAAKYIMIGIFLIIFAVITMLVTGM